MVVCTKLNGYRGKCSNKIKQTKQKQTNKHKLTTTETTNTDKRTDKLTMTLKGPVTDVGAVFVVVAVVRHEQSPTRTLAWQHG